MRQHKRIFQTVNQLELERELALFKRSNEMECSPEQCKYSSSSRIFHQCGDIKLFWRTFNGFTADLIN